MRTWGCQLNKQNVDTVHIKITTPSEAESKQLDSNSLYYDYTT